MMFYEVVTDTNIIYYLMIAVGVAGVLAKAVNQITLRRMVRAAGNMQKSTHKLIKLVRAKYEHALMLHDRVENAEAFVEKYIYEYRGFLFRVHTWRQLELQSIWFSGILAAFGGAVWYMENGFCEEMYRYISLGAAEMVLLFVISQLSDEQYKIEAAKNYMVDYLENVCAMRRRKARQSEKGPIDIIQSEISQGFRGKGREPSAVQGISGKEMSGEDGVVNGRESSGAGRESPVSSPVSNAKAAANVNGSIMRRAPSLGKQAANGGEDSPELSISIEGEPRRLKNGLAESAASGYADSGGTEAAGDGYSAESGGKVRRIPGRFQNVVQRMSGDPYEYEEILEGPPLPDGALESPGRTENVIHVENASSNESGQAAEYFEADDAYEDGEQLREYEYEKGRNRNRKKGDGARQVIRRTIKGNSGPQEEEPVLKEEAIRQILEEFLA